MGTLNFFCAISPSTKFFLETKMENPGVGWHPQLSVCLFNPPPDFSHIEVANPRIRGHAQLSVWLFIPPPEVFFSKSKWQIQEFVSTLSFLCAFLSRRRIFRTSNWQVQEFVGTLSFLCGFSFPPPKFFFRKQSGKSRSWWAPSTFCVLFALPSRSFLEIEVANPGVREHPQLSVWLFILPRIFFGDDSGKSRSWWAPTAFCVLFQPAAGFFAHRTGKSRSWWALSAFCVAFHSPPKFFLEIKVANPGVVGHPQLFLCFFTSPQVYFGNQGDKSRSSWAPTAFCVPFHSPTKCFSEIKVANLGVRRHPKLFLCFFTAPQVFSGYQTGESNSWWAP